MLLLRRRARAALGNGGEMSAAASANRSGRRGRAGVGAHAPWRRCTRTADTPPQAGREVVKCRGPYFECKGPQLQQK